MTSAPGQLAATTFTPSPSLGMRGRLRRATEVAGDLFALAAIALCIPFVIYAIGAPLALGLRLLLWITGSL